MMATALELFLTSNLTTTNLSESEHFEMVSLPPACRTLTYSVVNDHPIKIDYYLPASRGVLPAIIYYHGGGMTAGSRRSPGLPYWIYGE
jgi:acetyl esterase/lipase